MAYIKTLFKKFFNNIEEGEDNSQIYPVTVTNAVFDKDNNSLESLLLDVNTKIDNISGWLSIISSNETIDMEELIANSEGVTVTIDRSNSLITFSFPKLSNWGTFMWNYIHLQPCLIKIKGRFLVNDNVSSPGIKDIDFGTISWNEWGEVTIPNEILGNGYPTLFLARFSGPTKVKPTQTLTIVLKYVRQ